MSPLSLDEPQLSSAKTHVEKLIVEGSEHEKNYQRARSWKTYWQSAPAHLVLHYKGADAAAQAHITEDAANDAAMHVFAGRTSDAPVAIRISAAPAHLVLHHEEADAAAWAHTAVDAATDEAMDETAGYTSAAPAATDIRAGAAPTDRGHA